MINRIDIDEDNKPHSFYTTYTYDDGRTVQLAFFEAKEDVSDDLKPYRAESAVCQKFSLLLACIPSLLDLCCKVRDGETGTQELADDILNQIETELGVKL